MGSRLTVSDFNEFGMSGKEVRQDSGHYLSEVAVFGQEQTLALVFQVPDAN